MNRLTVYPVPTEACKTVIEIGSTCWLYRQWNKNKSRRNFSPTVTLATLAKYLLSERSLKNIYRRVVFLEMLQDADY